MDIDCTHVRLALVFPDGNTKADEDKLTASLKAGKATTLPAGTKLRIIKAEGKTPAEIQKADMEREQADIAARKAAKVKP